MKTNVKNRALLFKSVVTSVKDVDEKGMVSFYASVFHTPDKVKEIVDKGAYKKTLSEGFDEIQHYKNHDSTLMPGVIRELKEDDYGLLALSKLILKTQLGMETYEQYKAMADAGKSMAHSIGYHTIRKEIKGEFTHLKEIYLFEVSSLTKRPAHSGAITNNVKEYFKELNIEDLVKEEIFYTNLLNCKFTDAKLENLENLKNHISALIEESRRKSAPDSKNAPLVKKIEIKQISLK